MKFFTQGPGSFWAEFHREVAQGFSHGTAAPILTESDLASLPQAVQKYIRLSGAVGQPRVLNFRAHFHGKIRSGPSAHWMPLTGEQVNFDNPPARLFLMDASLWGIPLQAFHRFVGPSATMRVKVASALTIVDAKGPEMDEGETVTLFNDLCIFAPGALIAPWIHWQETGPRSVRADFTHLSHTISAALTFNANGELVDFLADGRAVASSDGKSFTKMPWSTPLTNYRRFGAHWLMGHGEGVWHAPAGSYSYLHFDLDAIEFNVTHDNP